MNEIKIFENEQFGEIRTLDENGKIYFCGNDVANALGYSRPRDAISAHCKGAVKRRSLTKGGEQTLTYITEGDLYRLITHSKLPSAEGFECWVFEEVLPSIRKYGAYATEETLNRVQGDTEEAEKLFRMLREEKQRTRELENENSRLVEENDSLAEVVDFINMYDDESDLLNISDIAIAYQMSAIEFNRLLSILGIQYRAYGTWMISPEYENCGYVRTDRRPTFYGDRVGFFIHTRWTNEGAKFLYNFLKSHDILPVYDWTQQKTQLTEIKEIFEYGKCNGNGSLHSR